MKDANIPQTRKKVAHRQEDAFVLVLHVHATQLAMIWNAQR